MTAAVLLDRLESVRETGPGRWLARCPAHEDRSPSLSIRELDDGTVLVHDFGGCEALSVVQAIGLDLGDLFPGKPEQRRRPTHRRIPAADALAALDHEIGVAWLIIRDVLDHREVDEPTWRRLAQASGRVARARALCAPARVRP